MAPGRLEPLVAFWKEWGILPLVLLSFSLQVVLLITAEIRRRKDSGVLKLLVWSAYLMADTTAIYTLGHMSMTITTLHEHQLMAFWAPFLLLHLGGQDNITAYAIEDNRLWQRHLQNFVVQAVLVAYVLLQSSIVALLPAAILIFVVAFVKYGERVLALKRASGSRLFGKNYQTFIKQPIRGAIKYNRTLGEGKKLLTTETLPMQLLDYPKHLLKGPLPRIQLNRYQIFNWEEMYGVAEVQLALMHDVFYTKAELIHTWQGYCIRAVSLLAIVAALVLFSRFTETKGYKRADVATTYVLLIGAVVLEITAVLRAIFSIWTYSNLMNARATGTPPRRPPWQAGGPAALAYGHGLEDHDPFQSHHIQQTGVAAALSYVAWIPFRLRSYVLNKYAMWKGGGRRNTTRYWLGSMGQLNLISMCTHCKDSRGSKIARWMGLEDWWNMLVYTSSVPVSLYISVLLETQIKASALVDPESPDHIHNSRGRVVLKRRPRLCEEMGWLVHQNLESTILVWHIATDVYLSWYEAEHAGGQHYLANVTKELSNYMMFLLASRPYMLPGSASRQGYSHLCKVVFCLRHMYNSEADLLRLIHKYGGSVFRSNEMSTTFHRAAQLGAKLISEELETANANMLELVSQVWVEVLCYAAYHCRPDSHARQLSNGGELTTVVAFLLEYTKYGYFGYDCAVDSQLEPWLELMLLSHEIEVEAIENAMKGLTTTGAAQGGNVAGAGEGDGDVQLEAGGGGADLV